MMRYLLTGRAAIIGLALAALMPAGCATPAGSSPEPAAGAAASEGGAVLTRLPAANLPAGRCGMILWTLDESRPAPVFRYIAGDTAEVAIGGVLTPLTLESAEGESAYGVYERQTFTAANGYAVRTEAVFSVGFDGGTYLERGLVSIETPDGWRSVSPAAGLAGCRS